MYIQTHTRDYVIACHTLFKCSKYYRVHIDTVNITVPHNGNVHNNNGDGESEEDDDSLKKAYNKLEDGSILKLVMIGMEVKKAVD